VPEVVIDANALISALLLRDKSQQDRVRQLLLRARSGELTVVLAQFVIFETIYVLRSVYELPPHEVTALLREALALPGVTLVDDCPWPQFFEHWSDLRPDVVDAALLTLAIAHRYTLATFDHKLSNRARTFGVATYW
jgi:predicted nucleic acid-binding protein